MAGRTNLGMIREWVGVERGQEKRKETGQEDQETTWEPRRHVVKTAEDT